MSIPEIGDRFVDYRNPCNFLRCSKRTRNGDDITIWSNDGPTPEKFCKLAPFILQEAVDMCEAISDKHSAKVMRDLLKRFNLSEDEKQKLWRELSTTAKANIQNKSGSLIGFEQSSLEIHV